ncbi:glycosyltransferase family 2 protein, partial [Brevundimonas sp. NPDC049575]
MIDSFASAPEISVVVPVHDESGAAVPLAREIAEAFAGRSYEMIFVNDASRDSTLAELQAAMAELPALRVLSHSTNAGQSRAVRTGVLAARAPIVVTLDGDGQNPPADAPRLADALIAAPPSVALVGGVR